MRCIEFLFSATHQDKKNTIKRKREIKYSDTNRSATALDISAQDAWNYISNRLSIFLEIERLRQERVAAIQDRRSRKGRRGNISISSKIQGRENYSSSEINHPV
jgi:hypothetical protein